MWKTDNIKEVRAKDFLFLIEISYDPQGYKCLFLFFPELFEFFYELELCKTFKKDSGIKKSHVPWSTGHISIGKMVYSAEISPSLLRWPDSVSEKGSEHVWEENTSKKDFQKLIVQYYNVATMLKYSLCPPLLSVCFYSGRENSDAPSHSGELGQRLRVKDTLPHPK